MEFGSFRHRLTSSLPIFLFHIVLYTSLASIKVMLIHYLSMSFIIEIAFSSLVVFVHQFLVDV